MWCEEGQLQEVDCGEYDMACEWTGSIYDCAERSSGGSSGGGCNGVSYEGYCDGNTVVWCEDGQVWAVDCSMEGMVCDWDWDLGIYDSE